MDNVTTAGTPGQDSAAGTDRGVVFLVGTRWFGVLGPCRKMIQKLVAEGFRVLVFGQSDDHYERYDDGLAELVEINMRRSYGTPVSDALDVLKLIKLARELRPVAVHSFNPKPALLSYAVVTASRIPHYFIGVTGLGNTFIRAKRFRPVVVAALRRAASRADFVFFQNDDDIEMFTEMKIGETVRYRKFTGPGVDLDDFDHERAERPVDGPLNVVCVSRLIWQKGIREYVEAARELVAEAPEKYRFRLVGEFDHEHPDCVEPDFIRAAVKDGVIEHLSWTDDVAGELAAADVNVLHSYREGAPRAILEASAMKLPTVGSDAIGVRELVIDGVTGYLVELKSSSAIAAALRKLQSDPELRREMGENAYAQIAIPLSLEAASNAQLGMYSAAGLR